MDKRRKWPLHQKANHSDPPYYQNSPRNYQKHTNPHQQHGGHPHNFHPYSHPNKGYSRPQHGYGGYQKSVPGGGAIGFYKTPPPPLPKIQDKNVGGAMAPPSSGGNTSSDVVTLIVENNNLKRMIVLHVNLMQEQTDSLAAKDKELDDQHDKLDVMLAQNQELKLANAQLEAKVEELRKQLRRKNKRPHDDDDDDHPLPPAATQQKVLLCNAETQTLLEEPVRIHPPQHHQHQQAEILSRILSQEQKQLELKPRLPHKADDHVPALPKSKARGEFNGKKVSTIFLHRVNQDSSLTSAKGENDEREEEPQPEEHLHQKLEEEWLQENRQQLKELRLRIQERERHQQGEKERLQQEEEKRLQREEEERRQQKEMKRQQQEEEERLQQEEERLKLEEQERLQQEKEERLQQEEEVRLLQEEEKHQQQLQIEEESAEHLLLDGEVMLEEVVGDEEEERLNLEEEELLHQEEEKRHQQLQMEEESEEHLLLDGEVILEEVVEDDIFHGALEPVEIEVATESFVGPEEELVADVNGHMDEGEEESSSADDDLNSHDSDDENEEPDSDTEEDAEEDEEEPEKNRMNSTDYNVADEKAIMPAAHSTPNHQQKYLGIEELEREDQQNQENELEEVEQMEVDSLERYISEDQSDMDLEVHTHKVVTLRTHLKFRELQITKNEKQHRRILKDETQDRGISINEKFIRDLPNDEDQLRVISKHVRVISKDEKQQRDICNDEIQTRLQSKDEKNQREIPKDGKQIWGLSKNEKQHHPEILKEVKQIRAISKDGKERREQISKDDKQHRVTSKDANQQTEMSPVEKPIRVISKDDKQQREIPPARTSNVKKQPSEILQNEKPSRGTSKDEKERREQICKDEKQHQGSSKEAKRDISRDEIHSLLAPNNESQPRETSKAEKQYRATLQDDKQPRNISNDEDLLSSKSDNVKPQSEVPTKIDENQHWEKLIREERDLRKERLEQLSKIEKQLREISKANKLHPKISKDMKQQRGKSTDQLLETAKDGKSKDHNQQQQSNDERLRQPTREQQLEATTPKAMPNAVAPKAGIHPNPPAANASLLKAKSADMTPTPKVSGAAVQQDAAGSSPIIANHQTSESSPADPVKKPRLQVKIRQHSLFNDKKQISVLKRNKEKKTDSTDRPLANANSNIAVERDLHKNESSAPISDTNEEQSLEERMRRKLQEHLQKERVRQSQAEKLGLLKKPSKESPTSDLIYPPIAPPTASSSSEIITPAPTPTTTLNITPASTPQPTPTSSQETQTMVASLKLDKIALPLTPQSVSSSSGISSIAKPTNVLNNRALHTYSKAPARSGKNRSMYRFATYPYTTRSWEDHEFHCDNEFFLEEADELLSDNPSIKIPAWRDVPVPPSSDKKNIENLSDEVFIQRHDKYVKDEIERKRRDARSIREQIRIDQLRSRHNQDEVVVPPDTLPATTFYPLPNDIEAIQFVTELPVQAFGENMVNMEALDDFSLPWLDAVHATTSIAKSKAQAVPVATLASKKIPTTAAEARHQEMNSSYVYLKRRKRQRRR